MTPKNRLLFGALVLIVGLAAFRLRAQQEASPTCNARYALVQGEYLVVQSKGSTLNERGLFRIDTVTGQTWRFVFLGTETYWDPIVVMQQKTNR